MTETLSERKELAGSRQPLVLLRLAETAESDRVTVQSWTDQGWRPVPVDAKFAGAFSPDSAPTVAPVSAGMVEPREGDGSAADGATTPEFPVGSRVVLLLPGSWVWSGVESIPRAARKQSSAVGYMVEERLAEDVEDLHFVCQPRTGDLCSVYAIRHEKMAALSAQLQRLQWPVAAALPEYQLLDLLDTDVSLWLDGDRAHIWRAAGHGLTVRRRYLQPLLASLAEPGDERSGESPDGGSPVGEVSRADHSLSLLGAGEQDEMAVAELESLFGHGLQRVEGDAGEYLLSRLRIPLLANLLVGDYRPVGSADESSWWIKPLKVAAACFVLQLMLFLAGGAYYSWQAGQQDAQARALFAELFPNARAGADVRRQIQGYLNQAGNGGAGFARQVTTLSQAWEQHRGEPLQLQSLRFDGNRGEMVIQLQAASLGELDGFVGRLSSGQYRAELLAANELEDGVSGRIRLR
ncbi:MULTISPECIES: type II secretion system protein GspL [Microbulbifer]|uniref:type II secretion system protein GspL n=1 Tax=Microbulbifer TaxID=48073 RepID=UPI001F01256B|nr:type II secretion system protein GspL [Microbulbifer zhoushanensis]